ncbi:DUF3035 domain-containing protein [Candidatus Odyssella thessalonicensis]|uniref:DUF3035 domain-containing protein n=1 Tax=Candidatus Odyssella thessalonicensis TaxID=84647 RepID=UPI000225C0A1|nr:DUF3035 domain-containing protein [Candidatus Odyssella thessalonicensis]
MNRKILLLSLSITTIFIQGCSSIKHNLGLDHYQADEYSIPTTPPLSMPPDHNLRAPEIQAHPTGYIPTKKQAQATLGTTSKSTSSETEQSFIRNIAKGQETDPNIRATLDAEAKTEQGALEKISNWGKEAVENIRGDNKASSPASSAKKNPAQTR